MALDESSSCATADALDDIEDMTAPANDSARPSRGVARRVVRRAEKRAPAGEAEEGEEQLPPSAHVPGTQSIYVKTYGCSHNHSDSEYMCGLLAQYGYKLVGEVRRRGPVAELTRQPPATPSLSSPRLLFSQADKGDADLWLINSCTVKNPSQEHLQTDISRGRGLGKPVVVAGCVSQAEPDNQHWKGLSIVGVQQLERVVEVVQESLRGNSVQLLERRERPALDLPKVRRNRYVEIIPCNTGCLGACTYCKTVFARGRLGSYDPAALLSRLRDAVAEGVREVWLTSEDTGAYGRDIGSSMPEMVNALLDALPDGTMLRVGMTNPPYMLEHLPAIAALLRHPRCYAFLHVPVQSGSNAVLGAMRREYTVEQFEQVADALLAAVPDMTLATDIIAGFPGESEDDHLATLRLVRKYRFPVLNISQFYPRPGTPAAKMRRVATHIVKERTRDLTAVFKSYALPHAHLVGTQQRVLATDVASDKKHLVAHTKGYVQVLLPLRHELLGCTLLVAITESGKFYVRGDVLRVLVAAPTGDAEGAAEGAVSGEDEGASEAAASAASGDARGGQVPTGGEASAECCGGGCGGGGGGDCGGGGGGDDGKREAGGSDCCGGGSCAGPGGSSDAGGGGCTTGPRESAAPPPVALGVEPSAPDVAREAAGPEGGRVRVWWAQHSPPQRALGLGAAAAALVVIYLAVRRRS